VDIRIFGGEPGQGDTEFQRDLKIRRTLPPRIGKHEVEEAPTRVSINACTSAKNAGANPAMGSLSPPNLSPPNLSREASGAGTASSAATLMPWP